MNFQQATQIVQIVGPYVSILVVAWGVIIQLKKTKEREITFKVHQQRKEKYEALLSIIIDIFVATKESSSDETKGRNTPALDQKRWFEVQMGMTLYASQDVLLKYLELQAAATNQKEPLTVVRKLGELFLMMRAEVGFDDTKLSARHMLGTFITDINDPKYNGFFS